MVISLLIYHFLMINSALIKTATCNRI